MNTFYTKLKPLRTQVRNLDVRLFFNFRNTLSLPLHSYSTSFYTKGIGPTSPWWWYTFTFEGKAHYFFTNTVRPVYLTLYRSPVLHGSLEPNFNVKVFLTFVWRPKVCQTVRPLSFLKLTRPKKGFSICLSRSFDDRRKSNGSCCSWNISFTVQKEKTLVSNSKCTGLSRS